MPNISKKAVSLASSSLIVLKSSIAEFIEIPEDELQDMIFQLENQPSEVKEASTKGHQRSLTPILTSRSRASSILDKSGLSRSFLVSKSVKSHRRNRSGISPLKLRELKELGVIKGEGSTKVRQIRLKKENFDEAEVSESPRHETESETYFNDYDDRGPIKKVNFLPETE